MKFIVFSLLVSFAASTFAQGSACLGEAQFIATAKESSNASEGICAVKLENFSHYQDSGVCPLGLAGSEAILVKSNGASCEGLANKQISGVLVLQDNGAIVLE